MIFIVPEKVVVKGNNIGYTGIRGYTTEANRMRGIKQLASMGKANYFLCFKDVSAEYAVYYNVWDQDYVIIK